MVMRWVSAVWKQLNCGKHHYNITFTYPLLMLLPPQPPCTNYERLCLINCLTVCYLQHRVDFVPQLGQGLGDGTEGELGENIVSSETVRM